MPGWDVHSLVDRLFFGKSYYKLHSKIDEPYKILGRKHRRYFHDPISARIIAENYYPGDSKAVSAAYLHILIDQYCSENPEYRKLLEQLAIIDRANRRKRGKKKKQISKVEEPLLRDLEKLAELRRLVDLIYSLG